MIYSRASFKQIKFTASQVQVAKTPLATFESNVSGLYIPEILAYIQATQSGTGDPSLSNPRAISGWSAVSVTRTGKNLFDKNVVSNNKWLSTTTGLEETASGYVVTDYIPVKNGQTVFIPTSGTARRWFYDSNKNPITYLNNSGNQAYTPVADGYIRVSIQIVGTTPVSLDTYQIEVGSSATTYEPYNGTTVTLQFGTTIYGGSIDWVSGVVTVTHQIVDLGSLSWGYTNNRFYASVPVKVYSQSATPDIICECYKTTSYTQQGTEDLSCSSYAGYLYVRDTNYTIPADFKTAMNGVHLVYELATPQTIQLTPAQIEQLLGENNVFCSSGDVAVKYYAMV